MDAGNLLEIKNLAISFHTEQETVDAVRGVSLNVPAGRTLGIVGESGSGKSVTALSILQLLPTPPADLHGGAIRFQSPRYGEINMRELLAVKQSFWKGVHAREDPRLRHIRGAEIAMIFQEPMTSLNPVFPCGDQVMEAIRAHENVSKAAARDRTLELFREVELPQPEQILGAYPHQISGGQKQRVMIAMALACRPVLLIADEPTTALDVTVQHTILELFERLRQEHEMSMIFITHDLGVIAEVADDVLVMYGGEAVEGGTVRQIFEAPQHPYTQGLLACRPPLSQRLRRLPTIADFMQTSSSAANGHHPGEDFLQQENIPPEEIRSRLQRLDQQSALVEVAHLATHFRSGGGLLGGPKRAVKAVDDVSFQIREGETLGLVGESGCGKTTLGRSLLRLVEPTAGSVHFDGTELTALSQRALRPLRRHMQIIFQDPFGSLNPRLPVGSAILEPMRVHRLGESDEARRERVNDLLERVGLHRDHYHRYPHEFSGGQRQRLCIARALSLEPRFIICDESVSALDVSVQAQVLNLLSELREEFQLTYLFISHDLSVVKHMSDRILVMKDGKILEQGPADEVYHSPRETYTQNLINAIPLGRLEDISAAESRRHRLRSTPA